LLESTQTMLDGLDRACHHVHEPPDELPILEVAYWRSNGVGRPRLDFDEQFLAFALELRGPTAIAAAFGCHPRTVRRRALEYSLLDAGQVPYHIEDLGNNQSRRVWNGPPVHTRLANISNEELDQQIRDILQDSPHFGRRMIDGKLRARGFRVSQRRISASYLRVHGTPANFGNRSIGWDEYSVAGVNSVWHHDGQHGLSLHFVTMASLIFL
jgi:hypothetical protein